MNNPKIICLGEALVDRLGPLGGDPAFDEPIDDCLGGAPANVACGLAKLGLDVAFIGCLGNDAIGQKFDNLFKSRGINLNGVQIHETLPTRIVLVRRDIDGERTFGGFLGSEENTFADMSLNLEALKERWPLLDMKAKWLLLGTIPLANKTSRKVVEWTIQKALQKNIYIAIDINWRPTFWDANCSPDTPPDINTQNLIKPFLETASLIKLAKEEAHYFFNTEDPNEVSKSLPQVPSVVITDGSNPIRWVLGNFIGQTQPLKPSVVLDTTGAGDAFLAGLISQTLIYSLDPRSQTQAEEMIRFAAACGALVCAGAGAIDPQPDSLEVENFLSSS